MNIFTLTAFGFLGGAVRVLVGLCKNKVFSGKKKFNSGKFWFTIITSGVIGLFCALLLVEDYRIILLAGYAGTDLLQGLYRTVGK
jgi:fluoride ion exporter CrcB/FEX